MNYTGLQILNCVWDGFSEATWFTEEKQFTLDYVCTWKRHEESCGCMCT